MKHKREDIQDLYYDYQVDGYERIACDFSHHSRWAVHYNLIFEYEGKYWRINWGEPATESQESPMWQDEYKAVEVKPVVINHTVYMTVEP